MDLLRLHYAPDNASLCVRLALEALGKPYEAVFVDRGAAAHKSADYLAMNPNGLIPVLELPEGAIFETGAILMWLSEQSPGELMPRGDAPGRAHAVQWMFWLSNTMHPALRLLFYPGQYIDGDIKALRAKTKGRLMAQLDLLEQARHADWLDTSAVTVQGCYLAPMLRWLQIYGGRPGWLSLEDWPRLLQFAQAADAWPATTRAARAEGLGVSPFSKPALPNPPEGSVF